MERVGQLLRDAIDRATPMLAVFSDDDARRPWREGAWSRKELLGHLVDSASNNHGRFVRAQFSRDLVFPGYEQERWVEMQRYADAPWTSLITLWRELNVHIARVMDATPQDVAILPRAQHNLDAIAWQTVPAERPATLEYFMRDYVGHLEHHLSQLLPDYASVVS